MNTSSNLPISPGCHCCVGIEEDESSPGGRSPLNHNNHRAATAFNVTRPGTQQRTAVRAAYNITTDYLSRETFLEVLQQCPALVELFNTQFSERLVDCYGSDPRVISDDNDSQPSGGEQNKDFTWILGPTTGRPDPSRKASQVSVRN